MTNAAANVALKMIEKRDFVKANIYCQKTMALLNHLSHGVDVYNVLRNKHSNEDMILSKIMNSDVKTALNLNTTWTNFNSRVYYSLADDFMKPVTNLGNIIINFSTLL